jgi:D-alanyl-D-alanine carboxypeptidase
MKRRHLASLFLLLTLLGSSSFASATPLLVNKSHPLQPLDYQPSELVEPTVPTFTMYVGKPESELEPVVADHLKRLFYAAQAQDISLILTSGYRPYAEQKMLYIQASGQNHLQEAVARPGYSEHQTGLAADVGTWDQFCAGQQCFMITKASAWLTANAHTYGFIVRYPRDKTPVTGYQYEPWHLRYVGQPTSEAIYRQNITLEEYISRV